jgi:hypothetical protein
VILNGFFKKLFDKQRAGSGLTSDIFFLRGGFFVPDGEPDYSAAVGAAAAGLARC